MQSTQRPVLTARDLRIIQLSRFLTFSFQRLTIRLATAGTDQEKDQSLKDFKGIMNNCCSRMMTEVEQRPGTPTPESPENLAATPFAPIEVDESSRHSISSAVTRVSGIRTPGSVIPPTPQVRNKPGERVLPSSYWSADGEASNDSIVPPTPQRPRSDTVQETPAAVGSVSAAEGLIIPETPPVERAKDVGNCEEVKTNLNDAFDEALDDALDRASLPASPEPGCYAAYTAKRRKLEFEAPAANKPEKPATRKPKNPKKPATKKPTAKNTKSKRH